MAIRFFAAVTAFLLTISPALAGQPENWQLGFQEAASPVMEVKVDFHNFLLWIIFSVAIFVLLLLVYIIIRFNKRANPEPAEFAHNTLLEVVWTVVPVIIVLVIAVYSFQVLYYADRVADPEMTVKVTGYQWYWGYEYPDHDGINFMSYMVADEDIDESAGQVRLLSTDTQVVLPIDTNIQIIVTAADVIHSWAVPALGIKIDAIPGRLNETWVRITKPGTYYGQCSEICGKDHSYMPIEIKAVTKEEFEAWVESAKEQYTSLTPATPFQFAYLEER